SEDEDHSAKFYEVFSKNLKLDIHDGAQNCSKLAEFLHFFCVVSFVFIRCVLTDTQTTSCSRSINTSTTSPAIASIRDSPFLKVLKEKDRQV
ncbi:hypothetical protein B0H14DRAFT_3727600, partial [Mycena olivaceomarginata]